MKIDPQSRGGRILSMLKKVPDKVPCVIKKPLKSIENTTNKDKNCTRLQSLGNECFSPPSTSQLPTVIEHHFTQHFTPPKITNITSSETLEPLETLNSQTFNLVNPNLFTCNNRPSVIFQTIGIQQKRAHIHKLQPKRLFPLNRKSNLEHFNRQDIENKYLDQSCSNKFKYNQLYNTQTQKKKQLRRYDRRNFCIFCDKLVLKFRRHLITNHKNENIVAEYIALFEACPKESQDKRRNIIADLTLRGNNVYNKSFLKNPSTGKTPYDSYLPVKRPPMSKILMPSDYITCTLCLGLFVRKHFHQHASECKKKDDEKVTFHSGSERLDTDEETINSIQPITERKLYYIKDYGIQYCPKDASEGMQENILKILRKDDLGKKSMNDALLLSVVSDFYSSHRAFKDRTQVTRKLRDGARLLAKVQDIDEEIFNPNKIDVVIDACQILCNLKENSINYTPSNKNVIVGMNGRLSWILEEGSKKLIDDIVCNPDLTEEEKAFKKRKVKDFQGCLRRRWKYCISTNIEVMRRRSKIFKPIIMPLDEDILKFASMLRNMETEYQQKLEKEVTILNYETLCKVTICHILTLNRRRPFEATHSEIEFYMKKQNDTEYYSAEVLKTLAEEEKVSFGELTSYVVPAKGIEEIATILLTRSMENSIHLIIKCRKPLKINNSIYLFARPGLKTPFDGSKVMREMKILCSNLNKPDHLTATGLRHHVATLGHVRGPVFSSKLSKFMCHTQSVHDKNYVAPLPMVHRGVIGNYLASLEGTTLLPNKLQVQNSVRESGNSIYASEEEEVSDDENLETCKGRKRWTEIEKNTVVTEFSEYIKNGINPGTIKCRQLLDEKGNLLKGRTPAQINSYIDNINKNKVKLPLCFSYLQK